MPTKTLDVMWDRLFKLPAEGGLSLQCQVRQMMVTAILDEHLPLDVAVPSSRELAERLRIARNTVVLAYQQLVDEGYLIARERSGYFVNPEILKHRTLRRDRSTPRKPEALDWSSRWRLKPSAQRNISKAPDWQKYRYPFIYGQFDPSLFPTNDWRECCQKILSVMEIRDWAPDLFTRDDPSLIEQIRAKVLPVRGVWASPDEIMITIGAQQALYLIADLLVSEQLTVGIEDPGYPDARNIFSCRTSRLRPLPIDENGLLMAPELRGCNYIYTTPSYQSPTTATMPMDRRLEFLQLADTEDFIIIEDDYESEMSFSGTPSPALKGLDLKGRVIYIGSLSKTLAPGLRLGFIVASDQLIDELRALRRLMIRHPSSFIQRSFALFLSLGHYDSLLRRLMLAYRERAAALEAALAKHLPNITHVPVKGGSSVWLAGPPWLNSRTLAKEGEIKSILIEPGDVYFMAEDPPLNYFRLGLSSIRVDRIEPGIRLLGELIQRQRLIDARPQ
jgi:GntR family transcriptional regulator/MocR family aminotransferase